MADPIARLDGVSYWYPGADTPSLRDVSLQIGSGLTLVAGSSGGGKSTLLRLFDGLVPQFHGGRISGHADVAGMDPLRTSIPRLATRVGLVFQDVETQSVYGTVEREVAFGLENLGVPRSQMHDRVDETLGAMGILGLRGRRLATLSGGERQLVQLAAVLVLRPELVALDEPTSQLDPHGAAAVMAACSGLAAAGKAVVLAEHRLESLLARADRLLIVERGEATGPETPRDIAALLTNPPSVVEFGAALGWDPLPLSVDEARAHLGELPRWLSDRPVSASPPARRDVEALEVRRLAVGPGRQAILDGIDMAVGAGEVIALVGPNGSGKTTLLRTLGGLLAPLEGTVRRPAGRTAYLPQNPGALLHLPTVRAEVDLTLRRTGSAEEVESILASFGLLDLADCYPRDLSSGERQRAAIAVTLAGSPTLALLDEPTRGMDLSSRRALGAAVRSLSERGSAVVIATHDVDLVAEVADRVFVLGDGRAVELGPPERACAAGSAFATQIGSLFPGGPVTVAGALPALEDRDARSPGRASDGAPGRSAGRSPGRSAGRASDAAEAAS
jgi:energy-coupling factor transport system ATP-binding protein